ncbi:MAG: carboxymuconolactone decarboxylase family protein [gamma proteobacterium symbiont of Bathyaustriella thionipta]|nr:carboxymuconolactone decarboxylase family protein [gamma proteobacterium symbiont of Bathyaustriella thionipta]
MPKIQPLTEDQAEAQAVNAMQQAQQAFGFVPNLIGVMAHAPGLAEAYMSVASLFADSSLSAEEQLVVLASASRSNECQYCLAAHSAGASMQKLDSDIIESIRNDRPISNSKLQALREFTTAMTENRAWLDEAQQQAFLDAGYSTRQMLEVILGITQKTLSNYTNHIAATELDEPLQGFAWQPPA